MAGISFLDLMFAEMLASELARESAKRERPLPRNVFLMQKPQAWREIKDACRKENMVFAVDITDGQSENCKRVDDMFLDMAREFDGLPFFIVQIGSQETFAELRIDLGGVQYTPTILIGFYGNVLKRVKYEGSLEVRNGLQTGRLKDQLKEFMSMRGELKAGKLAEGLAKQVKVEMSERERRIREEYEQKMKREMTEIEEKSRKDEEEKKKQQEEEEQQVDEKRRRAAERRRESRPEDLNELLKMDLDLASIREIKNIMIRMGISPHDCFERPDLKKKLIQNVPELRIALERQDSSASQARLSSSGATINMPDINDLDHPLGGASINVIDDLKAQLAEQKHLARTLKNDNSQLEKNLKTAKDEMKQMTIRANQAEMKVLAQTRPVPATSSTSSRVSELEAQLLQTRMLYTTNLEDFKVLRTIHDKGEEGLVLSVVCEKPNIPDKDRVYAMKVLANYFQTQTQTQTRTQFQNEYQVLCQLPPHKNVIHMWAFFFDRANPDIIPQFKTTGRNARTMSLCLLMDEHTMNMKQQIGQLIDNRGLNPIIFLKWFTHLLKGLVFLEENCVVHRDLKLDNLLLDIEGNLIISDFGKAILLDDTFTIPFSHGTDIGGNKAHLCPEVLNARPGPRKTIKYRKQSVWAAGVLAYELAGHPNPFEKGTIDQRGYSIDDVPTLRDTYCKHTRFCKPLASAFKLLVESMLQPEPQDRPTLASCLSRMQNM